MAFVSQVWCSANSLSSIVSDSEQASVCAVDKASVCCCMDLDPRDKSCTALQAHYCVMVACYLLLDILQA